MGAPLASPRAACCAGLVPKIALPGSSPAVLSAPCPSPSPLSWVRLLPLSAGRRRSLLQPPGSPDTPNLLHAAGSVVGFLGVTYATFTVSAHIPATTALQ